MRSAARDSGSRVVICEPTWTWTPTTWRPGRCAISARSARASPIGTPNLLRRIPVEMCGWLLASTSGFTRSATRVRRPWRIDSASMRSSSPRDSALMALRPRATARAISAALLPTPVKTIWCGSEAGLEGDLDLADRIAVGAGAEALDQAHQAERRVRLERVVDAVPAAGQGGGQPRVAGPDQARRCRRSRASRPRARWPPARRRRRPRRRRARRSRWERREWRQAAGERSAESDVTGPRDTPPIVCQGLDGACPGTFGVPVRFC